MEYLLLSEGAAASRSHHHVIGINSEFQPVVGRQFPWHAEHRYVEETLREH